MERIKRFEDKKHQRDLRIAQLRTLAKAIEDRDESLNELLAAADLRGERAIDLLVESGVADSIQARLAEDLQAFVRMSKSTAPSDESTLSPPRCSTYLQLLQLVVFLDTHLSLAEAVEMRLLSFDFLSSFRLLLDAFLSLGSLEQQCFVCCGYPQVFFLLSRLRHAELLEVLWNTELFNFMFNQLYDHSILTDQHAAHLLQFSLEFVKNKAHRGHDTDVVLRYRVRAVGAALRESERPKPASEDPLHPAAHLDCQESESRRAIDRLL